MRAGRRGGGRSFRIFLTPATPYFDSGLRIRPPMSAGFRNPPRLTLARLHSICASHRLKVRLALQCTVTSNRSFFLRRFGTAACTCTAAVLLQFAGLGFSSVLRLFANFRVEKKRSARQARHGSVGCEGFYTVAAGRRTAVSGSDPTFNMPVYSAPHGSVPLASSSFSS
jgi:hypothetical protein